MNSEERWEDFDTPEAVGGQQGASAAAGGGAVYADDGRVLDPETWMDYWSEELVTLWHVLKEQCEANGYAILDAARFPDFAEFAFRHSSGRPPVV